MGDIHLTFKKKLLEEGNWELQGYVNLILDEMSKKIRKVARAIYSWVNQKVLG